MSSISVKGACSGLAVWFALVMSNACSDAKLAGAARSTKKDINSQSATNSNSEVLPTPTPKADPVDVQIKGPDGNTGKGTVTGSRGNVMIDDSSPSDEMGGCRSIYAVTNHLEPALIERGTNLVNCSSAAEGRPCRNIWGIDFRDPTSNPRKSHSFRLSLTPNVDWLSIDVKAAPYEFGEQVCETIGAATTCTYPPLPIEDYYQTLPRRIFSIAETAETTEGEVEIPLIDAVGQNVIGTKTDESGTVSAAFSGAKIMVRGYDSAGKILPDSCEQRHDLHTPIVLAFDPSVPFSTLSPLASTAAFDLTGTGEERTIGWIKKSSALLALDFNQDGRINDGKELFGQVTGGRSFRNGYEAMQAYDSNADGVLNEKDPVFGKLLLWFDENADGKSHPSELRSLAAAGVTALGATFTSHEKHVRLFQNFVPFTGKFWGPKVCGASGCATYDVFFATITNGKSS